MEIQTSEHSEETKAEKPEKKKSKAERKAEKKVQAEKSAETFYNVKGNALTDAFGSKSTEKKTGSSSQGAFSLTSLFGGTPTSVEKIESESESGSEKESDSESELESSEEEEMEVATTNFGKGMYYSETINKISYKLYSLKFLNSL